MNMLNKMKIRTKLLVSFILIAMIAGIIGFYSIRSLEKLKTADTALYETVALSLGISTDISSQYLMIRINVRDAYIAGSTQEMNTYFEKVYEFDKLLSASIEKYKGTISDETDRKNFETLEQAKKDYFAIFPKYKQALLENDRTAAFNYLRKDWVAPNLALQTAIDNLVKYNIVAGKKMSDDNIRLADTASVSMIVLVIIGILVAVVLGLIIASNIQRIIKSVIGQTKSLVEAAIAGKLSTRANAEETNEKFREIVVGINQTLDAVIIPLNVAATYVDKISKGDMPQKITDNYNGDFNAIKVNLNQCIDAVNLLITDANMLSNAAIVTCPNLT